MAHTLQGQRLRPGTAPSSVGVAVPQHSPAVSIARHHQCPHALWQYLHSPDCSCFQPDLTPLQEGFEMLRVQTFDLIKQEV